MPKLNLQRREKYVLIVGITVALVVFGYMLARGPITKYKASRVAVRNARLQIQEARAQRDMVTAERNGVASLQKLVAQRNATDLATFVNRQLGEAKLQQRSGFRRRGEFARREDFEQLEVNLNGVSMQELVDFLYRLYSAGNIVVTHSATILPQEGGQGLKCTLVLLSPKATTALAAR